MAERIEAFKEEHLDDCAHLFMTAFNAEPWNDKYTLDTAKKQLAWHLKVPGCVGLVSVSAAISSLLGGVFFLLAHAVFLASYVGTRKRYPQGLSRSCEPVGKFNNEALCCSSEISRTSIPPRRGKG